MPDPARVAEGPDEAQVPAGFSRRGFFARTSFGALAAFAILARAPGAASARPEPPPCRIRCSPISRTGCGCGGHLYRCSGCDRTFHACVDGKPFTWICLRRTC